MKDEIKFKEYLSALCEIHDRKLSKLLIDLYWKILEPFSDEDCEKAFKELICCSKYFPKPADFTEIFRGKKEHAATGAWIQVKDAVARVGNYTSVRFSDPVIHSVIQSMGGWPQLCMMETKAETWKQREFEKLYDVISERPGKHPEYLPGTCEIDNAARGYDLKPDIKIIGFGKTALKMVVAK